ncbi:MAG: hypothetical protein RBT20_13240 [Syntrophales bacterium]|nr:hypothetical protein [Syntrophales bacterium]
MTETTIQKISYRTIYDSRGEETLEVDVFTTNGAVRRAGKPG